MRFVNVNVASFDAYKHGSQLPVIADARATLVELRTALDGQRVAAEHAWHAQNVKSDWDTQVDRAFEPTGGELPGQPEIIGTINAAMAPRT